jgi:AhpD family alkylhydroperoxidase
MSHPLFPEVTPALAKRRRSLAPNVEQAFVDFSREVFGEGALPLKTKHLIAVAVAHVTQCPWCIRGHSRAASRYGASAKEIMESIWVAAEMRAGAAYAHAAIALDEIDQSPAEDDQ